MEKTQSESEKDQSSLDLESPNYGEADRRIKKADDEKLDKLNLSELKLIEVPREVLDLTQLRVSCLTCLKLCTSYLSVYTFVGIGC